MRIVRILPLLLLLASPALAQGQNPTVSIQNGTANPATCQPAGRNVFFNRTTGYLNLCTAANTWGALVPGANVVGPGSSTDNAVVRFDGTGGTTIQNSVVTIGDTGVVAGASIDLGANTLTSTSAQLRTGLSDESGTGAAIFAGGALGAATATSINGNVFTSGTYTLTGAAAKTLTFNNSLILAGTDSTTQTFPTTTATIARTDAG